MKILKRGRGGVVTLPGLAKYKNEYTYKAYHRIFTPFATKKTQFVQAKNLPKPKKNTLAALCLVWTFFMSVEGDGSGKRLLKKVRTKALLVV